MYNGRMERKKAKRIEKIKGFVREAKGALLFGGVLFVSLGSFGVSEIYEAKQRQIKHQKEEREADKAFEELLKEMEEEQKSESYEDKTVNGIPQIDAEWYEENYSCKPHGAIRKLDVNTYVSNSYVQLMECIDENGYKTYSYREFEITK